MSTRAGLDLARQDRPIAILAPAGRDAMVISHTLANDHVESMPVSADMLLRGIGDGRYAGALITEEALARFTPGALERAIEGQPAWSDFPIVILTFRGSPPAVGSNAISRLGHVSLLERPVHSVALISAARGILRARARQREMEEFLHQRHEARANLKALTDLRELFEKAPGCIAVMVGPQHRFELVNQAFRSLAQREMLGRSFEGAFQDVAEQGLLEALDEVYRSGKPYTADELPIRLTRPSGHIDERFFTVSLQPLTGDNGQIRGVFAEAFEVTNRKLALERVQLLQNELIQVSRTSAMGAMASTLAHELNQPLMAITSYLRGSARLVENDAPGALDQVVYAMRQAEAAALRAGDVIRRARDMVVGSKSYHERVELQQLLSEALELATLGATEGGLVCTTRYKPGLMVTVDRVQIQQVVLNIVRNALEAMDQSGLRELNLTTRVIADMVEVAISDTGPGLDPEVREQLFTPFVSSKREGMGVGLSISRTIVEAHGGSIGARDHAGGGTVMWFTLPLTHTDAPEGEAASR